jgi:hypothetical protein
VQFENAGGMTDGRFRSKEEQACGTSAARAPHVGALNLRNSRMTPSLGKSQEFSGNLRKSAGRSTPPDMAGKVAETGRKRRAGQGEQELQ